MKDHGGSVAGRSQGPVLDHGDPDRFLTWVRDPAQAPVGLDMRGPGWRRLVHDAFAYADRSHARSVSDGASARLACTEGCAWCCYLPITTTAAEVAVAWEYARTHLAGGVLEQVRERATRATGTAPEPCPFLVEDRCGVYPVRPLACRAWNSTDASACERAHEAGADAPAIPVLTVVRGVFANAAQALARGVVERGGEPGVLLRAVLGRLVVEAADCADPSAVPPG